MQLPSVDVHAAFWRDHDRSGVLVSAGGGGLVVLYALATWGQSGREWLLVLGLLVLLAVPPLLLLLPEDTGVRARWRGPFYYSLEVVGIGVVTTLVWLDGGLGSPLTILYLLLLVHGIAVYPTRVAVVMTALVLVGYLGLALAGGVDVGRAGAAAGAILLTAGVSVLAARSHITLQQHQARVQDLLRVQARTDGLTGALNRQGMAEALVARLAATDATSPTSVLAVDLDGFKALNDDAGHLVGDRVLQQVVATLQGASRAGDLVGRPGGDELLLLLPEAGAAVAEQVAVRIHDQLRQDGAPVTVSIGIATATGREDAEAILGRADRALYAAKRAGGGRTCGGLVAA